MVEDAENPFTMKEDNLPLFSCFLISETLGVGLIRKKKPKSWEVCKMRKLSETDPLSWTNTTIRVFKKFEDAKEELCAQLKFLKRLYYENGHSVYNFEYDHYDDEEE